MDRDAALAILVQAKPELMSRGVLHAALFGSTARSSATKSSDVDVLIDLDPKANLGVYEYVGLMRFIDALFPQKVDVANRASLKAHVRPSAERDAIYAF